MGTQVVPSARSAAAMVPAGTRLPKAAERAIARIEGETAVRATLVRAEAIITGEKMDETDYLIWKAMSSHAMLRGLASNLAGDDPGLMDDMRFFTDMSRLGKGELIASLNDKYHHI